METLCGNPSESCPTLRASIVNCCSEWPSDSNKRPAHKAPMKTSQEIAHDCCRSFRDALEVNLGAGLGTGSRVIVSGERFRVDSRFSEDVVREPESWGRLGVGV